MSTKKLRRFVKQILLHADGVFRVIQFQRNNPLTNDFRRVTVAVFLIVEYMRPEAVQHDWPMKSRHPDMELIFRHTLSNLASVLDPTIKGTGHQRSQIGHVIR